ncbi:MAG: WD40 repeat domain-containing protein, partial [Planctomycetota bacterium]
GGAPPRAGAPVASYPVDAHARRFAVGTDAGGASRVEAWDLAERSPSSVDARRAWSVPAEARVVDLELSPDDSRLAAASWDQRVRVLDVSTGTCESEHVERNNPTRIVWSPRGDRLVSIGISWTVEVWRTRPDARAFRLPPPAGHSAGDSKAADPNADAVVWGAFTNDGRRVVLLDAAGRSALFEACDSDATRPGSGPPGALVCRLDANAGEALAAHVAVALDAPRAVWVDARGRLRAVDTERGETVGEARLARAPGFTAPRGGVRAIALSPDGRTVALVDGDGVGWTWSPGEDPARVERPAADESVDRAAPLRVVTFGPGSHAIYFGDSSGSVLRHVPSDPGATLRFEAPAVDRAGALDIAVSPDGREVVVALEPLDLQCWDIATGRRSRQPGRLMNRRWVDYLGDGRLLSCATGAQTAAVLGRNAEAEVGQAFPHDDEITSCAVAGGGTFVTGSLDRTVLVWSADDGQALARAAVHGSPVLWVAASSGPDGTRVLSCAADGAVVWPVEVLREAQRRAPRDLSPFERLELEALVGGGS